MNKKLILILVLFLLVLSIVFATDEIGTEISSCDTGKGDIYGASYNPDLDTIAIVDPTDSHIYQFQPDCTEIDDTDASAKTIIGGSAMNTTHHFVEGYSTELNSYPFAGSLETTCTLPAGETRCRDLFFPTNGTTQELWCAGADNDKLYQGFRTEASCYNWAGKNISAPDITNNNRGGMVDTDGGRWWFVCSDAEDKIFRYDADGNTNWDRSYPDCQGITFNVTANGTIQAFITDSNGNIDFYSFNGTLTPVDETPPIITCAFNISITNIKINDVLNFSCNATDETELSTLNMTWNYTTGIVYSNYTVTTPASIHNTTTITDSRGNVINFTGYATDTSGNVKQNSTLITIANTPPTQPNIVNTSGLSYAKNQTFNITPSTDVNSDTLTYFWYLNSTTDSYPNLVTSGIGVTNWNTNTTNVNTYYLFVNVSDGVINVSGNIFMFYYDADPPVIDSTSINNTAPKLNEDVQISINITDNNISSCWYSNDITGTLLNKSSINLTISQTQLNYSVNITNTLTRGNVVISQFTCNDTLGNSIQSSAISYTVVNTNPSTPTIILPTPNDYNNTHPDYPFNVTFPVDVDGDSITIYYYINGLLNQTSPFNVTFNASDGYYILNVSLTDGIGFSSNATVNFTIDTTIPTLLQFNLSNNTRFGYTDATMNITVYDDNPFNLTFNWHNSSVASIYSVFNTTRSTPTTITIIYDLNLIDLASGNYTLDINFSDTHTSKKIDDYKIVKLLNGFSFETTEGNTITISEKNVFSSVNLKSNKLYDRYTIEYGKTLFKTKRTFIITADNPIMIVENSKYKGHITIGNGFNGNWMDFENGDKESKVKIKRINEYSVEVEVHSKDFNFKSIGGLHVINVFYKFQVDNDEPEYPESSINNTNPFQGDTVNLSFYCYDFVAISTCIIGHNDTGTWVNASNTTVANNYTNSINFTYQLTIASQPGETVGVMACANDTFNMFSCSSILTLQVNDTEIPTIVGASNFTRYLGNQTINFTYNVTDNLALSIGQVIITENNIARYFNFSLEGQSAEFSQNFTISASAGECLNVTGWVNDSYSNYAQNETIFCVTRDFFINASNIYDNVSILDFTVILYNSTYSETKTTSDGLINFSDIISGLYNINFSSNEYGGYHNRSYQNYEVSQDLEGRLHQATVYFTAVRRGTDVAVLSYNLSTDLWSNVSNSSGGTRAFLNASNYEVSSYSTDYFDIITRINLTNQSISDWVVEFCDINLSIELYSIVNNSPIGNFTVLLTGNGSDFSENVTVKEGNATFCLGNNSYNIIIESAKFASITDTFYIGSNDTFPNLTYSLLGINSINFSVYDEITNQLLLENTTINIIGSSMILNSTIDTGLLYVQDLTPGEYRITYDSDRFRKRDHYVTITNATNNTVQLYLLSTGNGTDVTFTVQDNSGNELSGALINLKRYYVESNSYKVVAMSKTNAEGKTIIDVDFNDAFYETFTTFGDFSLNIRGARFISTTFIITLNLLADPFETIDGMADIVSAISFNNLTETFSYTYNVLSGVDRTGIIEVYRITPVEKTLVCEQSTSSSSATILCVVNTTATAGTYIAEGSILVGTQNILLTTYEVVTGIVKQARNIFGNQGLFLGILLSGTLAGIGAFVSPAVAIIMFLVGIFFSTYFGLVSWGIGNTIILISIIIIGGVIIYKVKS